MDEIAAVLQLRELEAKSAALRESEARYRALFEVSPQMVWFADAEGQITYANQHCVDFVGTPATQMLGESWVRAVHPDDRERVLTTWAEAVSRGASYEVEFRLRRASDGSFRWMLVRGAPLQSLSGRLERWIGIGLDIDDRRRAEAALRDLIEALGVAVYTTDEAGRLTFYNEAAVALWGWRPPLGDVHWCGSWRIYWPDGAPMRHEECPMALALQENRPLHGKEAVVERPDGTRLPFSAFPTPLHDGAGQLIGGVNVLVDITERKAAEAALAGSEERLRLALEAGRLAFWELDLATGAVLRAPSHDGIFGYGEPLSEWSYEAFLDHVLPEDRADVQRAYRNALDCSQSEMVECRIRRASDGEVRWLEVHGRPQQGPHGRVVRLHGVLRDITVRKRAEAALRRSEARLRLAQEVARIGTWEWDPETGAYHWTPEQYALFGLDPTQDGPMTFERLLTEVVHPDDRVRVEAAKREAVAKDETYECLYRARRRRGARGWETRWVMARGRRLRRPDGSPGPLLGVTMDVTERQATEARLQQLQSELLHISRLSAAGEMASALAHELNQPLTATVTAIRAAKRTLANLAIRPRPGADLQEAMDLAAQQALRAGQIVQRLRAFVARGEADKRLENLSKLIEEAGALALAGARERGIHFTFRLAPRLPPVIADRIQVQQVVVNLIRNALDAMGDDCSKSGTPVPRRELVVTAAPSGSDMVEVAISDTGPGLEPKVADRLFEPFVSTKPGGMGVGLSICRSIIEAHGGRLWAEPNLGGGTVLRFLLPAAPSEAAA